MSCLVGLWAGAVGTPLAELPLRQWGSGAVLPGRLHFLRGTCGAGMLNLLPPTSCLSQENFPGMEGALLVISPPEILPLLALLCVWQEGQGLHTLCSDSFSEAGSFLGICLREQVSSVSPAVNSALPTAPCGVGRGP